MRAMFWRPSRGEELRRAANVIADAVQTAKDIKIAETEAALEELRRGQRHSRGTVHLAVQAFREVGRTIADLPIEEHIEAIGKDLT